VEFFKIMKEIRTPAATAQVVHYQQPDVMEQPINGWDWDCYRIDMCLTPRPKNVRARYRNHWDSQRFEALGSIYTLLPGEQMQFRSEGGTTSCIICELRPEMMAEWLGDKFRWSGRSLESALNLQSARIRGLLQQLGQELFNPGLGHEFMVELITTQVALELARFGADATEPTVSGLASWRLRLIDDRLAELQPAPTVSELAELCRVSTRQLMRGFQASRGCSIGAYVAQSRVRLAKGLLATDKNIKTVAALLGFSSPSSFTFAFRRATGLTPCQFREQILRRVS